MGASRSGLSCSPYCSRSLALRFRTCWRTQRTPRALPRAWASWTPRRAMIIEPQAWVLIGLGAVLVGLAIFALRIRSLFAMATMLAAMFVVLTCAMMAFDAPDIALLTAFIGIGIIAP